MGAIWTHTWFGGQELRTCNSRIESDDWGLCLINAKAGLWRHSAAGQDWSQTIKIYRPLCHFAVKNRSIFVAFIHFCGVSISTMAAVKLQAWCDANHSENELGNTQDALVREVYSGSRTSLSGFDSPRSLETVTEKRNFPNTQCRGPAEHWNKKRGLRKNKEAKSQQNQS